MKPGLNDTMVMTGMDIEKDADDSFANYGEEEAEQLRQRQQAEAAAEEAAAVPAEATEAVETAVPAAEEAAEEIEKPIKAKGGVGRTILKVLLVILIIIFVIELAGIGIKWLAPDSGAAEFIDNQLNKVIHLITGSEIEYQVPGVDYEV